MTSAFRWRSSHTQRSFLQLRAARKAQTLKRLQGTLAQLRPAFGLASFFKTLGPASVRGARRGCGRPGEGRPATPRGCTQIHRKIRRLPCPPRPKREVGAIGVGPLSTTGPALSGPSPVASRPRPRARAAKANSIGSGTQACAAYLTSTSPMKSPAKTLGDNKATAPASSRFSA